MVKTNLESDNRMTAPHKREIEVLRKASLTGEFKISVGATGSDSDLGELNFLTTFKPTENTTYTPPPTYTHTYKPQQPTSPSILWKHSIDSANILLGLEGFVRKLYKRKRCQSVYSVTSILRQPRSKI